MPGLPKKNAEGYADPTVYWALKFIEHEEHQRLRIAINSIKSIVDEYGFELLNRIELKDRRSGREYK